VSSPQVPPWTVEEFEILLNGDEWTAEDLVQWLPRRTDSAIRAMRAFVHTAHVSGSATGFSQMMQDRFVARQGTLRCALCKTRF
jgi:hypothetical protein